MSFLNPPAAEARRRRWLIGGAAVAMTVLTAAGVYYQSIWLKVKPATTLIYFQSWSASRSRADAVADTRRTEAARAAKLAESRAYIATLSGQKRIDAQKQYDAYVAGGGAKKDIPYAVPDATLSGGATGAEPPVQ